MARPIAAGFGAAFRRAYTDAGLTQVELAERLRARGWPKVDQTYVSRWARGLVLPPLDMWPDLDAALGEPKGYVLELAGLVDAQALVKRRKGNGDRTDPFSHLPGRRDAAPTRKPRAG